MCRVRRMSRCNSGGVFVGVGVGAIKCRKKERDKSMALTVSLPALSDDACGWN